MATDTHVHLTTAEAQALAAHIKATEAELAKHRKALAASKAAKPTPKRATAKKAITARPGAPTGGHARKRAPVVTHPAPPPFPRPVGF